MSALIGEPFVAVTPTLIATFGPVCAIVLQQVHFVGLIDYKGGDRGECAEFQDRIALDTGLSVDQVQKALARLVRIGAVVSSPDPNDRRRRVYAIVPEAMPEPGYRPERSPSNGGDLEVSADLRRDVRQTAESSVGTNGRRTREEQTSPTPPQAEGPSQSELFAPGAGGAVTAQERKRRNGGQAKTMVEGAYRAWLDRWPKGNRGSIPAGSRAFAKAVGAGATMDELDRQARNYQAARVAYHEAWAGVGDYWPTLMHCSTFLNSKRAMWDQEWGPDDLRYWPAPAGWSWEDRPVTSHDAGDDVPAEVRAQGGVAVAMWKADQRRLAETGAVAGG